MASEDWFLRLDPYNFDTEEEQEEFLKSVLPITTTINQNRSRGSGSNKRGLGGKP